MPDPVLEDVMAPKRLTPGEMAAVLLGAAETVGPKALRAVSDVARDGELLLRARLPKRTGRLAAAAQHDATLFGDTATGQFGVTQRAGDSRFAITGTGEFVGRGRVEAHPPHRGLPINRGEGVFRRSARGTRPTRAIEDTWMTTREELVPERAKRLGEELADL